MTLKKRIGVLLCGCGHRDGSEVHEATLTLLSIDRAGATAVCFAPSGHQRFVRDHTDGKDADDVRDMLVESARISRGNIRDVAAVHSSDLDALIIPGGQGAGLNLSDYLAEGRECEVHPEVERLICEMSASKKPIGAICIAPATLGRVLEEAGVRATLTIGTDAKVASDIEAMGHRHVSCEASDCVVDQKNRVVTTPAYMTARSIGEVWAGVEKLVKAVVEMAGQK